MPMLLATASLYGCLHREPGILSPAQFLTSDLAHNAIQQTGWATPCFEANLSGYRTGTFEGKESRYACDAVLECQQPSELRHIEGLPGLICELNAFVDAHRRHLFPAASQGSHVRATRDSGNSKSQQACTSTEWLVMPTDSMTLGKEAHRMDWKSMDDRYLRPECQE